MPSTCHRFAEVGVLLRLRRGRRRATRRCATSQILYASESNFFLDDTWLGRVLSSCWEGAMASIAVQACFSAEKRLRDAHACCNGLYLPHNPGRSTSRLGHSSSCITPTRTVGGKRRHHPTARTARSTRGLGFRSFWKGRKKSCSTTHVYCTSTLAPTASCPPKYRIFEKC